jgi:SAM-dependent methyltransferase|tara:strand:- start:4024 stop:4899 length:876 start_codon:yes stop_codon:yes gene_type:complete
LNKLNKIKYIFPWWIKIILKIIFSRIPLNNFFKTIMFKHGGMLNHSYVFDIFTKHIRNAGCKPDWFKNRVLLELGPGDSLFSSILAKAYGASGSFMVDTGSYANTDLKNYIQMVKFIRKKGMTFPIKENIKSVDDMLDLINAKYYTSGLESLRKIEKQSIDFIWSEAVLEHIRLSKFYPTLIELKRILKKDGICTMTVDLRDHLQNGLNNLRFNRKLWESEFFANSGFYTNRIGFTRMIKLFEKTGFKVKANIFRRWDTLPIEKKRLDREFRNINNNELMISGFSLLITHK